MVDMHAQAALVVSTNLSTVQLFLVLYYAKQSKYMIYFNIIHTLSQIKF